MCDIILAMADVTAGHSLLFGKNSDRQRNEAQLLELLPAMDHASDTEVICTYIRIPQASRTNAVLISRPFWTWGAEMGANEHGVVIGNEAVQARTPAPQRSALIGMDLVRLALERASSASEATEVITTLLQAHGQGGNCGHTSPSYYNNSFIVADANEAFLLETVGSEWLLERVRGVRAISNQYSIEKRIDRSSSGMSALVASLGFSGLPELNYADILSDPDRAHIGSARGRRARATALLQSRIGQLDVTDMMKILRDHTPEGVSERDWDPKGTFPYSLCIHAGDERCYSQTTSTMVSEIGPDSAVHWVTATSAPCISIFKPVLLGVPLPSHGPPPGASFDPDTLWWRHEQLHRRSLLSDYKQFLADIRAERDAVEAQANEQVRAVLAGGSKHDRAHVVSECWRVAIQTEARWLARLPIPSLKPHAPEHFAEFHCTWERMSAIVGMRI